jgi:hypothetical protein
VEQVTASNATEQIPSAAVLAVTLGIHPAQGNGSGDVAGVVSEMHAKPDALVGILTRQFARAPATTKVREGGRSEAA